MNKMLIGLLIVANINVANAYNDSPTDSFDASNMKWNETIVVWKTADDVNKACNEEGLKFGLAPQNIDVKACSFWRQGLCVIVTSKRPNMHSLGHELRHCFQGTWH